MKLNAIANRTFWLMLGWLVVAVPAHAFYDPALGRWLNRDPLGEPGLETLRSEIWMLVPENPYEFVGNAPLFAIDPFGLEFVYWPPYVDGNCNDGEERQCQEVCFAQGLVLKRCTVTTGKYLIERFSDGVQFYKKWIHWRQAHCECRDPRTCPPPPGTLGKGRNDPPNDLPPFPKR